VAWTTTTGIEFCSYYVFWPLLLAKSCYLRKLKSGNNCYIWQQNQTAWEVPRCW